jgi:hypothetical protein
MRYRLKAPITAVLDKPDRTFLSVKLPAGVTLQESSAHSTTLFGLIGVIWEGRHYSVALHDLLNNAERVQSA